MFSRESSRRSLVLSFLFTTFFITFPDLSYGSEVVIESTRTLKSAGISSGDFGVISAGDSRSVTEGVKFCAVCSDGGSSCEGTSSAGSTLLSGSSEFSIVQDGCAGASLSISMGESQGQCCNVSVNFKPTSVGDFSATCSINWTNDQGGSGTAQAPVSGVGKRPATPSKRGQCIEQSSTININQRSVTEEIPVVGLNQSLVYSSERIQGNGNLDKFKFGFGGWALANQMFFDFRNNKLYSGSGALFKVNGIPTDDGYAVPDETGNKILFFDQFGTHLRTQDALLGTILQTWTYDSSKRLIAVTNQFQQSIRFEYYNNNSMDIVSVYGQRTRLVFNQNGWLASVTNPVGETYLINANSAGYVTAFQKPNGHVTWFNYDDLGFLISDVGSGGNSLTLSSSYDSETRFETLRVSTALGRTTFYQTLSLLDRQSSIRTDPNQGQEISFSTDTGPVLKSNSLGEGYQGIQAPDPRWGWNVPFFSQQRFQIVGSTIDKTTAEERELHLSNSSDMLSLPLSLKIKTKVQNDPTRTFVTSFESNNKSETFLSPLGRKISKVFDANGNLSEMKIGDLEPVRMSYDDLGRLVATQQSDRPSTEFSYDGHGNVSAVKDSSGKVIRFVYDDANRMTKKITSDGNEINFSYNAIGQIQSLTPPGRPAHNFTFNTLELIGSYLPPDLEGSLAGTTLYSYNLDKQLTQILKIGALPIQLNYDTVTGALTSMQSGEQSYQMTYKPLSNLPNQIVSPGQVHLDYDYVGSLLKSVKTAGEVNHQIQFDYNNEGRLSRIHLQDAARAESAVELKYDKDDLLVQAGGLFITRNSFSQVSESQIGKVNEKLFYNKFGELTEDSFLVENKKIFSNSYERDHLGRVHQIKERNEAIEYVYDVQGRLEKVKNRGKVIRSYSYDANGNRTEKKEVKRSLKAKYDDQDRLLQYGNKKYEYNMNGDLVKIIETKEGHKESFWEWLLFCIRHFFDKDHHPDYQKVTRFSYDNFGSLTRVSLPDGKRIEYIIDGQNRRIGKKIDGKLVQSFIYQSQTQIAAELNGEGKLVRRFVYGIKLNVPDYVVEADRTYRIISNQVGTPVALVDVIQGKIEKIFSFDEFGIGDEKIQNNSSFPFGFAGGLYDTDTKLVRFGARDYDPETGRWVTKDPIGFAGGDTNIYSYTFNDPINFIDPKGTDACVMNQGTGVIICTNDFGEVVGVSRGYSGSGAGRNNPSMENVTDTGPIPQGTYIIGSPYNQPGGTGNFTRPLNPIPNTRATFPSKRNPDTFRWHGDNGRGTASEGCPISDRATRSSVRDGSPFEVINWSF